MVSPFWVTLLLETLLGVLQYADGIFRLVIINYINMQIKSASPLLIRASPSYEADGIYSILLFSTSSLPPNKHVTLFRGQRLLLPAVANQ